MRLIGSPLPLVDGAATIVSAATGQVAYVFQESETDVPGQYEGRVIVNWPAGPQTFPADGSLDIRITSDLTDVVDPNAPETFCTIADVYKYAGVSVDQDLIEQAQAQIEVAVGRTIEDMIGDDAIYELSSSDRKWLRLATAYQAGWMADNTDWASRLSATGMSQGTSLQLTEDGVVVSPLARKSLLRLSWMGSRVVRVQSGPLNASRYQGYVDSSYGWRPLNSTWSR
jgi:hypothetical protein